MTTKHTPGPWAWLTGQDGRHSVAQAGTLASIAELRGLAPEQELEANARLIAAAPALLEALQHIWQYDRDGLGAIGEVLARRALAKATGDAS